MVNRTELLTLHIDDLLHALGVENPRDQGSMVLMANGEEQAEVDLDDLCMVIQIRSVIGFATNDPGLAVFRMPDHGRSYSRNPAP